MVLKELKKKYPNRKVNFKEYDDDGILYDQYGFNSQGFSPIQPGLFGVSQAWGGEDFLPSYLTLDWIMVLKRNFAEIFLISALSI